MVRVAKCTGLPIGAVMLVGRPVIFSSPRNRSAVPPCGGAGGGADALSSATAAGLAAGAAAATAGGGLGAAGLAGATLAGVWAMAAAAAPSGSSARIDQPECRFTVRLPDQVSSSAQGALLPVGPH